MFQVLRAKELSEMKKYGVGQSSPGSGSAGGSPMVSPSIASKSSELLNTAQSDVDPLAWKDYWKKSIVVMVHGARFSWSFDGDVFAINGSAGMVKIPAGTKIVMLTPWIWVVRDRHDHVTGLIHNGL